MSRLHRLREEVDLLFMTTRFHDQVSGRETLLGITYLNYGGFFYLNTMSMYLVEESSSDGRDLIEVRVSESELEISHSIQCRVDDSIEQA